MGIFKSSGLKSFLALITIALSVSFSSNAIAYGGWNGNGGGGYDSLTCNRKHGKNIVVHVKTHTEDIQGTLIAARLAGIIQKAENCNVTLFLTLRGARLADMRMPQNLTAGRDDTGAPTLAQAVAGFQANGGTIAVCPACAGEIGLTSADLIPGATILTADGIAELFIKADKILDF